MLWQSLQQIVDYKCTLWYVFFCQALVAPLPRRLCSAGGDMLIPGFLPDISPLGFSFTVYLWTVIPFDQLGETNGKVIEGQCKYFFDLSVKWQKIIIYNINTHRKYVRLFTRGCYLISASDLHREELNANHLLIINKSVYISMEVLNMNKRKKEKLLQD